MSRETACSDKAEVSRRGGGGGRVGGAALGGAVCSWYKGEGGGSRRDSPQTHPSYRKKHIKACVNYASPNRGGGTTDCVVACETPSVTAELPSITLKTRVF